MPKPQPKPKKKAPLDLDITYVRGVGAKKADAFKQAGVHTLRDLLYYVPRRYIDRSTATPIGALRADMKDEVTVIGTITETRLFKGRRGQSRFEAALDDGQATVHLVWFRRVHQISRWMTEGTTGAFSGKVQFYRGIPQIAHPEMLSLTKGEIADLKAGQGRWVALYPGGKEFDKAGLDARGLRNLMDRLVGEYVESVEDPYSEEFRQAYNLPRLTEALDLVHRPRSNEDLQRGQVRLKFDELFLLQLLWVWTRHRVREKTPGIAFPSVGPMTRRFIKEQLPFQLTDAQSRVMREIWSDMQAPHPMTRLLQGDVGSGKTVIALIAMVIAVESGFQAALMAPTEILAEQHLATAQRYLEPLGLPIDLLTGSQKTAARKDKLARLAQGEPGIVIGTHALIQEGVRLPNLGLTVIDEQHRFGVAQRMKLMEPEAIKGRALDGGDLQRPDVLVMTATPIPRSLGLTLYGDLDVSRLDEMPPGRGTVTTTAHNADFERQNLYSGIAKRIRKSKDRAYIIFPLIAESEKLDLAAAESGREELLAGPFKGLKVGLLHGRMNIEEKAAAMEAFATGKTPVLVSTTVVEVGVDVPEATIMVIEHAERFGLSQLHQLRGRIGRGGRDGHCYLIAYPPVGHNAKARLRVMTKTTDGFLIAEEDLRLRGAGDFFGTRQSGMPELRFADIVEDQDLVRLARQAAEDVFRESPDLGAYPSIAAEFKRSAMSRVGWIEVG